MSCALLPWPLSFVTFALFDLSHPLSFFSEIPALDYRGDLSEDENRQFLAAKGGLRDGLSKGSDWPVMKELLLQTAREDDGVSYLSKRYVSFMKDGIELPVAHIETFANLSKRIPLINVRDVIMGDEGDDDSSLTPDATDMVVDSSHIPDATEIVVSSNTPNLFEGSKTIASASSRASSLYRQPPTPIGSTVPSDSARVAIRDRSPLEMFWDNFWTILTQVGAFWGDILSVFKP